MREGARINRGRNGDSQSRREDRSPAMAQ